MQRSVECGRVSQAQIGREVTLAGWVQRRRDLGGLIFIDLRDRTGIIQVVFNSSQDPDLHHLAEGLRGEYVVAIRGTVKPRPEGTENRDLPTGLVEVEGAELAILNTAKVPPFVIENESKVDEGMRTRYRYLDLRRPKMYSNLLLRHRVAKSIRDFFDREGFLEVETPMLIKSTPEGARDYLVPSRVHPGKFYALPQSPQLFKQILMVSGVDRYFQIARCFRDEDLRADRQPEFTQVDVEMSFVERDDVLSMVERLMAFVFRETLGVTFPLPAPRLSHAEAMARYGSDKPDLRFDLPIQDLSGLFRNTSFQVFREALEAGGMVKGIVLPGRAKAFSRKSLDELSGWFKEAGGKGLLPVVMEGGTHPKDRAPSGGWSGAPPGGLEGPGVRPGEMEGPGYPPGGLEGSGIRSPLAKHLTHVEATTLIKMLGLREGDLLLIAADTSPDFPTLMGRLRLELVRRLALSPSVPFHLSFVVDFPLFHWNPDDSKWEPEHHPFTSPLPEDRRLLEEDPGKVRAAAYDPVLNGNELGSGSIRIHDREMQERIFRILGLTTDEIQAKFGFLLEAFEFGAPPHGGVALGLDRMVAIMAGEESIREVIAFPKNQSAACPMTGAPVEVAPEQLELLKIRLAE